jgi:hypothetical protein
VGRLELDSDPKRALAAVTGAPRPGSDNPMGTLEPEKPLDPDAVRDAARKAGLDERETNELVKLSRALVRRASAELERAEIIDEWVDHFGEQKDEDGLLVLTHPDQARRVAAERGWSEQETLKLVKRARQNSRLNEALMRPGSAARRESDAFWSVGP